MPKSILEMVSEIVAGQSGQRILTGEEIDKLIKATYRSLKEIESLEISGVELEDSQILTETAEHPTAEGYHVEEIQSALAPNIEPSESIHEQEIICMECGKGFKQLTPTHLNKHNLTASEYREKYGFRNSQALAARASTEKRRSIAKELGTGQRLKMAREARENQSMNLGMRAKSERG